MISIPKAPNNSIFEIDNDFDGVQISWKTGGPGPVKYLVVAFLLVWLGGWSFGLISVIKQISTSSGASNYFLIFWLCGWSVGGLFAMLAVYTLLKPSVPESVTLHKYRLVYNAGSGFFRNFNPQKMRQQRSPVNLLKFLFPKKKVCEYSRTECPEFILEGAGLEQRIYFDDGAERIEIGDNLKEPEREWLADILTRWKKGEL